MTATKTVLVAGANGLVGRAVVRHMCGADTNVIAAARTPPERQPGVRFVAADLNDQSSCAELFGSMPDVTHLVYTALYERPALVSGWSDDEQIAINDRMFRHVLDPLSAAASNLRHVTLLQGTKAYGVHVRAIPVPAREDRDELRNQPNFYWEQETHLRDRAEGAAWTWTILRPTLIVGGGVGGAMNALPPIGVFGALLREAGLPFTFPGGGPRIAAAVDVDLLARAIDWAGDAERARNQTFNVTNGDVYVWENVWPAIADVLGMEAGAPEPRSLHDFCGSRSDEWETIRDKYDLLSPSMEAFVGPSLQYCDYLLRHGDPSPGASTAVSTVKVQSAGFHEVMDSEDMFKKWFRHLQDQRLLPPA